MIALTRLHGESIVINADLIELIEQTPDTMISTTTGKKFMVKETVGEVVGKVIEYRHRCATIRNGLPENTPGSPSPISPPA